MPLQVGAERYNLFTGCPQARTATIVLRGGSEQFIDEADRWAGYGVHMQACMQQGRVLFIDDSGRRAVWRFMDGPHDRPLRLCMEDAKCESHLPSV